MWLAQAPIRLKTRDGLANLCARIGDYAVARMAGDDGMHEVFDRGGVTAGDARVLVARGGGGAVDIGVAALGGTAIYPMRSVTFVVSLGEMAPRLCGRSLSHRGLTPEKKVGKSRGGKGEVNYPGSWADK